MLIIPIAFITCINAVDIDPETLRSVAHSLLNLGRISGNQHLSANLANSKNPTYKSIKEVWSSNSIPNVVVSHQILPFLRFREAINAKVMDEQEIIKYFASKDYNDPELQEQTYQDIINYSLRDLGNQEISDQTRINNLKLFLDNAKDAGKLNLRYNDSYKLFEYGRLEILKYLMDHRNVFEEFKQFNSLPFLVAARYGQTKTVKWILKIRPQYYKRFIFDALEKDQKHNFLTIFDIAETETEKMQMNIFNFVLAYSLLFGSRNYIEITLDWVSDSFQVANALSQWGEKFIKIKRWNPTVENLDFFFSQKVWNPRTVRSVLTAMSKAADNVMERIGMELLNPRFKFRDTKGSDPLEKAIEMASTKNQATYGRVLHVLHNIQRSNLRYSTDQHSVAKKPRLKGPVYLGGFGSAFHPLN